MWHWHFRYRRLDRQLHPHIRRTGDKMKFRVTTEGQNQSGLREFCERYVNDLWMPDHLLPHEAKEFALDHFKRAVMAELEMLVVEVDGPQNA
jgi:hypothetical protein